MLLRVITNANFRLTIYREICVNICNTCKVGKTTKWYSNKTECRNCYRKRIYMPKENKYSLEKAKTILKDKFGDTIKLIDTSYKGFGYSAVFIDAEFGEFKAKPHNVIVRNHGHRARTLEKRTQTNIEKFGVPFASQCEEVKKKMTNVPDYVEDVSSYIVLRDTIKKNIRSRLRDFVFRGSSWKCVGCSPDELIKRLESQFHLGMTWDNYGLYGWHIDHIKPLASFDLTDEEQFKAACHYSNLQPLWAKDNLSKGSNPGV